MSRRLFACLLVSSLAAAIPCAGEGPSDVGGSTWRGAGLVPSWGRGLPESDALRVPSPITRDDEVQQVTLKETIAIALENNPGIAAQRLEPTRQETAVLQAQSSFDPTLSGELTRTHSITPNASSLAGTRTLVTDDRSANLHLFKTFRTGTLATVDFLNDRLDANPRFQQLRPQYKTQLNLSVVQPLLRNFGWDFSYLVVRVAQQTAEAALFQYEAQLANFVEQVIEGYWSIVRARENLQVQRESKALADRTVDENEARVRVGLLPPVAVLEAQADAKSREEQVIRADNDLAVARQLLAQLVYYRPHDTFVPRTLEPAEEAVPEEVAVDLDRDLAVAIEERPEVLASARGVRTQQLNERIASNALLPQLDLVGSYGVNGLSGTNRPISTTTLVNRFSSTDLGGGRCIPLGPGEGFICQVPATVSFGTSPFAGPASEAYERLTSNDFRTYSVGVQFQVPLSNALARSEITQSRIARTEAELNHRETLSTVTLEVRQSTANLTSARQRIDTTRVARELAEENLRNQEKRHEVGMATTKDLLDFQTRLTTARAAEVQAKIDYAIAVAQWRRAQGRLLSHYQVVVERKGRPSVPWFARF